MKKIVKSEWRYEQNLIKEFIEKKLRTDIGYDQKNCKIVREADLHTCVYSRLQKFFKKKGLENWYILNEVKIRLKNMEVQPDLVIAMKKRNKSLHAKFVIELKERKKPYLKLLEGVMEKYAKLIAKWMSVGFIHGVMNTDNMSITCETIDYGPCAFIDKYNNNKVFSSIDHFGRYSYGNQPNVAKWNLARFAETILPLIDTLPEKAIELANDVIEKFTFKYKHYWLDGMRRKIGLYKKESGDEELIQSLLNMMQENQTDFTLTFRKLCDASSNSKSIVPVRNLFKKKDQFDNWVKKWRKRLILEEKAPNEIVNLMCNSNPAVIPRNHRIEQVIQAAEEYEDFTPFEELLDALLKPYEELEKFSEYTLPPKTDEEVLKTFCGT